MPSIHSVSPKENYALLQATQIYLGESVYQNKNKKVAGEALPLPDLTFEKGQWHTQWYGSIKVKTFEYDCGDKTVFLDFGKGFDDVQLDASALDDQNELRITRTHYDNGGGFLSDNQFDNSGRILEQGARSHTYQQIDLEKTMPKDIWRKEIKETKIKPDKLKMAASRKPFSKDYLIKETDTPCTTGGAEDYKIGNTNHKTYNSPFNVIKGPTAAELVVAETFVNQHNNIICGPANFNTHSVPYPNGVTDTLIAENMASTGEDPLDLIVIKGTTITTSSSIKPLTLDGVTWVNGNQILGDSKKKKP